MKIFLILFCIFSIIKSEGNPVKENTCLDEGILEPCKTNEDCQHYGYCDHKTARCCLGHNGQCTFPGSWAIRPQIGCETHDDCGLAYCDGNLKICCSEGESSEGMCPNQLSYLSVEPNCKQKEDCQDNSTCEVGHCCPGHKVEGVTVTPLLRPYLLNRRCHNHHSPPFRNTFCRRDTNRLVILGETRMDGTENINTERICVSNMDCSPTSVCVFNSSIGSCYEDPLGSDPPFDFLDPILITIYVLLPISFLLLGIANTIQKSKSDSYYFI